MQPVTRPFWTLVFSLLLLAACDAPSSSVDEELRVESARVAVAAAQPATFGERFTVSGTLTAERHARLSPRVDGLVSRVRVNVGDYVKPGQTLLELDPSVASQSLLRTRAEAQQAAAAVREAERLVAEAQRLIEHQAIAATEVQARASALDLARAAAESANAHAREQEELVARHAVPAPFSGVVAEKLTEAGEWVQRGTPVLYLVATDQVRLDLRVPQERFGLMEDDAQIRVFSDLMRGEPLQARIAARVPVTDPGGRTFLLRLLVEDPQGRLLPGTSARAEISLPETADTVAFSRDALLRQPDGSHTVYIVVGGETNPVVRRLTVRVLHEQDGKVAVASRDVERGQLVVIGGNESLRDGMAVNVVER